MKKIVSTLLAVCLFAAGFAQTPITLPLSSPYSQDFNTTPGATGTTYPAGWVAYNFATTLDDAMIVGNSGTNTGANYNYGSCIGILGSGSNYLPGTIVLAIANTTGKKDFKISYKIRKIREQTRNNTFNLQAGTVSATGTFTNVTGGAYDSGTIPQGTETIYTDIVLPADLDNKSTPVYIRFYYSDIAGSGSRDGVALDDVVLSWSPLGPGINTPTIDQLADVSVRLGANVFTDEGNAITQRGIVIGSSANPAVGQPGVTQLSVSGTLGVFDTLVTLLTPGTQYHFRGFATNASGTAYTASQSFYTLSPKPAAPLSLTATATSEHDIRLDWNPSADASGYLVLQKMYTAPAQLPANATRYIEGQTLGDAEVVDTIYDRSVDTRSYSGLVSGSIYYYMLVPFRFNGTHVQTYHYNTDAPVPVAHDTTWGNGPSAVSDLVGITGSEPAFISSLATGTLTAATDGIKVWQLALRDGGSLLTDDDNMSTSITRLVITKGAGNTGNWQNHFAAVALFDDTTGARMADAAIYRDSLVFSNIVFTASDNNLKTATLRITLKTSGILDMDTFRFAIERANVITPWLNTSSQIPSISIASGSGRNVVDVVASQFVITQQPPAAIGVNALFAQPVRVQLRDANQNTDRYNSGSYHLTSSGPALLYPRIETPVTGELIFDSVGFGMLAQGAVLKIWGNQIDTAYTIPVNVFASNASAIYPAAGFTYTDSIPYLDHQATVITPANAVPVFAIKVADGGASLNDPDLFGTSLSSVTFAVTDYEYIRTLALFRAGTKIGEAAVTSPVVTFDNLGVMCNDNDSLVLTLYATFKSRYAHGRQVSFLVTRAVADTALGSVFALADAGGAASSSAGAANVLRYRQRYVTPPVVAGASVCAGSDAVLVAVPPAGLPVKWYASASDPLPVHVGDTLRLNNLASDRVYYASSDSLGWPSEMIAAQAKVARVTVPAVNAEPVCMGTQVTLTATSALTVSWYRSFLGTQPIASGNILQAGTLYNDTVFYVQADSASCLSERKAVTVHVTFVTPPEVRDTAICRQQPLTLSALGVHPVQWFRSLSAASPIASGASFIPGSFDSDTAFYAASDSSGCLSARQPVRVAVKQVAPPELLHGNLSVCASQQALLLARTEVSWYDAPDAPSPLAVSDSFLTPALTASARYYARAFQGGCSSEERMIRVEVKANPLPPVVSADSVCMGAAARLSATGTSGTVTWFDAPAGGNALQQGTIFVTPVLNTGITYYVQSDSDGCVTARVPVQLHVKARPAAPSVMANLNACSGTQLKLGASAPAGTIKWFKLPADTIALGSDSLLTEPLAGDVTYFAAAEQNNCLSVRQTVNIKVTQSPSAVFTVNSESQCLENNQFILINAAGNPQATRYAWEFGDQTSFAFMNPVKTFTAKGTYTITLRAVNGTCSSESSKVVNVTSPDVDFTFAVSGSTVTFVPAAEDIVSYRWRFTVADSSEEQRPVHVFSANGTYTVTLVVTGRNGCSSSVSKTVTIVATGMSDFLETAYSFSVYPNPAAGFTRLAYVLKQETTVRITLLDAQGRQIAGLHNGTRPAGEQELLIDTEAYARGVYFIHMQLGGHSGVTRLLLQ